VGRGKSNKGKIKMAEGVGFEPTVPCGTLVFKTSLFVHSSTPPDWMASRLFESDQPNPLMDRKHTMVCYAILSKNMRKMKPVEYRMDFLNALFLIYCRAEAKGSTSFIVQSISGIFSEKPAMVSG
jgi:hypothetical protein